MFRSNLLTHKICVQKGMNSELDIVSDQLLICLNDIIVCIQTQEQTLDNEIKNFRSYTIYTMTLDTLKYQTNRP